MSLTVILECMSLQTVLHHLRHDALRMENEFIRAIEGLPSLPAIQACIATPAADPRTVVGMAVYRGEEDALHFALVRVSEPYRGQGLAKRLLTEVVTHPANILVRRITWPASAGEDDPLIRHLRWLGTHAKRICGTGFAVEAKPRD